MTDIAELQHKTTDCAWCDCRFDDVIELLEHVEITHLDGPTPAFDAAA